MSGALPGVSQGQRVFFRNRPDDEVEGAESAANHRAFAVWFEDTKRWDPCSFEKITWQWPQGILTPIGSVLKKRKEKVDREKYAFSDLQPITIHFDGSIDPREVDEDREYTMELQFARPGDVVVAKIDLKNGAVGILPEGWENAVVTTHFAVYEPDKSRLLPEYLHRIIQTNFFKKHLWNNKVGAEGRKEVKLDFFESQEIPLPSLEIQEAIVSRWRLAQEEIVAAQVGLRELYEELSAECYSLTTFAPDANPLKQRKVALNWDGLDVWDMKSARAGAFRTANPHFVPMRTIAQEVTILASPSREAEENPEKEWPVYGVNNREGVVFSHFQKGEAFNASYKRIKPNWFFHNPTRSAVGSLGIVPKGIEADAITSPEYQVWKIRDDRPDVPPDFIALLIRTTYFVDLVQVHRVGAVKQRLYTENLLDIPVPVLTKAQMQAYASRRQTTLERIAKARIAAKTAALEVEEMILGKRPITL